MARLIRKARQYGFTLVELLIVVAIIGVLSTIGIPSFRRMIQKSKKSEAKVNLGGLYTAEQAFFSEYGAFGNHLPRMGFQSDGQNLMYSIGFVNGAGTCAHFAVLPAAAGNPYGLAIAQTFPQYYAGTVPPQGGAATIRTIDGNIASVVPPGRELVSQCLPTGVAISPAMQLPGDTVAAANTIYSEPATATPTFNRFVAVAAGVIAPGVDKQNPVPAKVDMWGINSGRVLINLQDGVQ